MKGKRAAFDIQKYLIGILLFMGVMVTLGTMAVDMGKNYETIGGAQVSEEFIATYDQLDLIENETQDLQEKVTETTTGTTDAQTQFFGDALSSIKLIIPSTRASISMITGMAQTIGIPTYWLRIFGAIIIILIVTTIVFMVFKSRGTN